MILSLIAAADEGNCIGGENRLLWDLPDDLKRFRTITKGKPVIMGRKTYDSIGRPLPHRRNIVMTKRSDWERDGVEVVHSLADAIDLVRDEPEAFIIGGGSLYRDGMDYAQRIYLTRVHVTLEGDTYFPVIDPTVWKEVRREEHAADAAHQYAFTYIDYERV
ncbi:MAG: dihydrofolate reductase [Candidatus Peribacteraceae bacterium]